MYSVDGKIFHHNGTELTPNESLMLSTFTLYIAKATSAIVFGSPIYPEIARINESHKLEVVMGKSNDLMNNEAFQHLLCFEAIEQVISICAVNHPEAMNIPERHNAEPIITFFKNFISSQRPNSLVNISSFTTDVLRRNIDELGFSSQLSTHPAP